RTGESRNISAWPDNPSGWAGQDMRYRFQWTAPIAISPHDPKVVYHGANVLFRTADGGQTWTAISGDLTRNDKTKEQWSGGPITGDNTGVETYCTIFVVAESPVQAGLIWAGSDDGLVHVTEDGGKTWRNVTASVSGLPDWGTVSMIEPSRFDAKTAYLVVDAHRLDDMRPYLWKTTDLGRTWKRLDGGLPKDVYLHSVREDPAERGTLYLGTERGVAFSTDDGATWRSLRLNLPTVAVHDLQVKDDRLVLGTHGRSAWILDDLPVIRALEKIEAKDVEAHGFYLFPVPDTVRWTLATYPGTGWTGTNPPRGARVYYWLKDEPKEDVKLEVLDASGRVVNTLSSKAPELTGSTEYVEDEKEGLAQLALHKGKGVQRAVWAMIWDGAEMIPQARLDSGYPLVGPAALPGTYTVRLTVDGKTATAPLKILPDPRSTDTPEDLEAQLQFALDIRDQITRLTRTVLRLQSARKQLAARNDLLAKETAAADLIKTSKDLIAKLDALEEKLQNPRAEITYDILAMRGGAMLYSRLSPLFDYVKTGDGAPTQGAREVLATYKQELDAQEAALNALLEKDLATLNSTAANLGYPTV